MSLYSLLCVCRVLQRISPPLIFTLIEFETICEYSSDVAVVILVIARSFFFSSRTKILVSLQLKLVSSFLPFLCFLSLRFLLMHSLRDSFPGLMSREQKGQRTVDENVSAGAILLYVSSISVSISSYTKSTYINTLYSDILRMKFVCPCKRWLVITALVALEVKLFRIGAINSLNLLLPFCFLIIISKLDICYKDYPLIEHILKSEWGFH